MQSRVLDGIECNCIWRRGMSILPSKHLFLSSSLQGWVVNIHILWLLLIFDIEMKSFFLCELHFRLKDHVFGPLTRLRCKKSNFKSHDGTFWESWVSKTSVVVWKVNKTRNRLKYAKMSTFLRRIKNSKCYVFFDKLHISLFLKIQAGKCLEFLKTADEK